MYIIHIAGMVLYVGKEFYVIQILELFYVEIIIFPVIFDGQTPLGVKKKGLPIFPYGSRWLLGKYLYLLSYKKWEKTSGWKDDYVHHAGRGII